MTKQKITSLKNFSYQQLLFLCCIAAIIINFFVSLSSKFTHLTIILNNYVLSTVFVFTILTLLYALILFLTNLFNHTSVHCRSYAFLIMTPLVLLLLMDINQPLTLPLVTIFLAQCIFLFVLSHQTLFQRQAILSSKAFLSIFALLYFVWACYINIQKFNYIAPFNPRDYADFNQLLWNTIHGRFFQLSSYGSLFACHNNWFYMLLLPFYALAPHPLTLMFLKAGLLSLCVIPCFLIIKRIVPTLAIVPITLVIMLNPHFISQNFNAPHEICFAPFFLLFMFYFFRTARFFPFLLFLLISLSIKEQVLIIPIMIGVYAFFEKRKALWVVTPIIIGIVWGLFSIMIILYFNQLYPTAPKSTWLITDLGSRFFQSQNNLLDSLMTGVQTSNLSKGLMLQSALKDLSGPVGIIVPFFSFTSLLGLPELILTLLSDRISMLGPNWHYNVIFICFFLVGTVEGLKKISSFSIFKKLHIDQNIIIFLLSILLLSSTVIHYDTWIDITKYSKYTQRSIALKTALTLIPSDASVTASRSVVVYVSSREHFSLLEQQSYLDYILIDNSNTILDPQIIENYTTIFHQNNFKVLKKSNL